MKKEINLGLNIVLIVAVAVLFVLHFTSPTQTTEKTGMAETEDTSTVPEVKGHLKVAYVNIDTLLSEYQMYQDKREEFIREQTSTQSELQNKRQELQQRFEDLKEKLNKGMISRAKARMMQKDLGEEEQNLYQMRDQMSSELAEKEQVIYRQVLNSVTEYLDDYAEERGYHFILSYSFGGSLLYKNEKFNITREVLQRLNEQYNEQNN